LGFKGLLFIADMEIDWSVGTFFCFANLLSPNPEPGFGKERDISDAVDLKVIPYWLV
jgi:hypothetical protein